MHDRQHKNPVTDSFQSLKYLFFMPSFYGAVTWGAWLFLYSMKLMRIDPCTPMAMSIYLFVEGMFLLSTFVGLPRFMEVVEGIGPNSACGPSPFQPGRGDQVTWILVALHTAGLIGLAKYVVDFSGSMGGIYGFVFALLSEAEAIRSEAQNVGSIGTQISYLGWLAIGLTVYHLAGRRISRWWWLAVLLQFAGNLLFIDRTRPVSILFASLLMALPAVGRLNVKRILSGATASILFTVICFWMIAEWSGKTFYKGLDESRVLPGITQDIYMYGVSGFAYFNYMLGHRQDISYAPVRLFYPLNKTLSAAGLIEQPPNPVLEFYDVPFSTNVGTFLEPLYRDGGLFFIILGTVLYTFGVNTLSLSFLRSGNPVAYYAWATLCFTTFICFFVPKISFVGTWLFVGLGAASLLANKLANPMQEGQPELNRGRTGQEPCE